MTDVSKRYIAILGGSFNPIHNGHLQMAISAHKQFDLDSVIVMPNKTTYYKENKAFVSDEHRLNMLELATCDYEYMSVSDMEIRRGGVTHTIDTVRELLQEDPDRGIYFIIGGDSLEWVDKWVEAEELLKSVTFLTAVRGETDHEKSLAIIERLEREYPFASVKLLDMEEYDVSSSDIRRRVQAGESITGLVPENVEKYILDNKLYLD